MITPYEQTTLHFTLLLTRTLIYNVLAFSILILSFTSYKKKVVRIVYSYRMFWLHLAVSAMLFGLSSLTAVSMTGKDPTHALTDAIGDFVMTPILVVVLILTWVLIFINENKYKKNIMKNGGDEIP